jgi:5'-nucleotidase (lipoprotein e(P4) family)
MGIRRLSLALLLVFMSGCAAPPSASPAASPPTAAPEAPTAAPEAPTLGDLLGANIGELASAPAPALPDSVHWARSSAEHRAAYEQAYRLAAKTLAERVAELPAGTKWAVVLDCDETVLDNSLYQKARGSLGFGPSSWKAWVRMSAAKGLPGAAAFLASARASGGVVAIVTDREIATEAETRSNLAAEGLAFDLLLCKPASGDQSKGARFKQIAEGHAAPGMPALTIVMWVGDNIRDFPDGDQQGKDDAFFAQFGSRFFVLPNPMYGSWPSLPRK